LIYAVYELVNTAYALYFEVKVPRPELYPVKKLVGFDQGTIDAIETWRGQQKPIPNVSEAIRRLVEMGLASAQPSAPVSKRGAAKASKLAGSMIDWLGDQAAPPEVQEKRKRRLLKGPPEFRGMRRDLPKRKG
jgi:hypothetical protein